MEGPWTVDDIEKFLELLVRSELVRERDAKYLAARFRDDYLPTCDVEEPVPAFCTFLVGVGTLTMWQCEKLRMGKWKGFHFDSFVLLEQVGKDNTFAYYLARDRLSGAMFRLAITPVNQPKRDGKEFREWEGIQYRVDCQY